MSDKQDLNDSLLRHIEETSETSTLHVQSRANVSEDQGTGLEVFPTMIGESLDLPVKITISLLSIA